jgi:hypothetical protein
MSWCTIGLLPLHYFIGLNIMCYYLSMLKRLILWNRVIFWYGNFHASAPLRDEMCTACQDVHCLLAAWTLCMIPWFTTWLGVYVHSCWLSRLAVAHLQVSAMSCCIASLNFLALRHIAFLSYSFQGNYAQNKTSWSEHVYCWQKTTYPISWCWQAWLSMRLWHWHLC